jgi:hypothetical protein
VPLFTFYYLILGGMPVASSKSPLCNASAAKVSATYKFSARQQGKLNQDCSVRHKDREEEPTIMRSSIIQVAFLLPTPRNASVHHHNGMDIKSIIEH